MWTEKNLLWLRNRRKTAEGRLKYQQWQKAYRRRHCRRFNDKTLLRVLRINIFTKKNATMNRNRWSDADDYILMTDHGTAQQLAIKLGRTLHAVKTRRQWLNKQVDTPPAA